MYKIRISLALGGASMLLGAIAIVGLIFEVGKAGARPYLFLAGAAAVALYAIAVVVRLFASSEPREPSSLNW